MSRAAPHVVVESLAALRHAASTFGDAAHWVTMSPCVTEALRDRGASVVVLDELLTAAEADAIGYAALDAAKAAAAVIDAHADWPLGTRPGAMLVRSLHRAITAFLYKAALMDRLRREIGPGAGLAAVGNPESSAVTGFEVQCSRFDTLLATFAEAVGGSVMHFDAPKPSGSGANGDFMRPSLWTRLVTVLNAPVSSITYRLLRRISSARPRRVWFGAADIVAAVFTANELVEEAVTVLAGRGARVLCLPPFPPLMPRTGIVPEAAVLQCRIAQAIDETVVARGLHGPATACVGGIVASRTVLALARLYDLVQQAERWCDGVDAARAAKPLAVLSNAISSPADHLAAQRLTARGIPLYVFEHGVGPGLDENHEAVYRAGLAPWVDGAVYYTQEQRLAVEAGRGDAIRSGVVAGAPAIVRRVGFAQLQRRMARRGLGFGRGQRVLAWVSGLYPNNMPFLPHYYRDGSYHALRRRIVYDVLGKLDDRVLLKLYPTFRHTDPDPFAGFMHLPGNCRAEHLIDFRNLRAAADVILVDVPGSTLAWCWGAGVPIIYLDTEMRLTRAAAEEFDRALFYVDTAREGWTEALAGLLALPHRELLARWREKAEARAAVGAQMIVGPEGKPGAVAASYIVADLTSARRRAGARELARAAE